MAKTTTTTVKKKAPAKPKKTTAAKRPRKSASETPSDPIKAAAHVAAQCVLEKKATNIKLMDVHEITSMTDFFIICSASSDIQVKAIAENVIVKMRDEFGISPWKSEGWDALQWIIVDFVDFVVHIFRDTAREFYNLERLWADAPTELIEDKPAPKKRATKKS
jgi:ribosome-associated protein